MSIFSKLTGKKSKAPELLNVSYEDKPFLKEIKPKRRYVFHSDYFEMDGKYCTILSYIHPEAQNDRFSAFWGVNRVVMNVPKGISIISFENVMRYTDGWVTAHQNKAEGIVQMNDNENQNMGGTTSAKMRQKTMGAEIKEIAEELQKGAAYMGVTYRMLIKADSLEELDKFVDKVQQTYIERFGTLTAGPFEGCQKDELSNLLKHPDKQRGKKFSMTSMEFAGSYNLVTKGLDDKNGEYVGVMTDDVNNSAILFNVNGYDHHIVVASNEFDTTETRNPVSGYWCSKISQSTMIHNNRTVHFIFDGTVLDELGPAFKGITRKLDLSRGDINMFEMFGDPMKDNELSIFSEHLSKISLMLEQLYPLTQEQRGVTLGVLKEILEQYYIENRMWYKDAVKNKKLLRILGIPHNQYPTLSMFMAYVVQAHKAANAADTPDIQRIEALGILKTAFTEMLDTNGDLFNTITNSQMDDVDTAKRVIYDFSDLMLRSKNIAMAQFVNIVAYAIRSLKRGDTVIIHGTENISQEVKDYVNHQFDALYRRGGRVCYAYNNIDKAFDDNKFCKFDQADYTIFGAFTSTQVDQYQKIINQVIPANLVRNLTKQGIRRTFIRRDGANVLFNLDLVLGISDMQRRFK